MEQHDPRMVPIGWSPEFEASGFDADPPAVQLDGVVSSRSSREFQGTPAEFEAYQRKTLRLRIRDEARAVEKLLSQGSVLLLSDLTPAPWEFVGYHLECFSSDHASDGHHRNGPCDGRVRRDPKWRREIVHGLPPDRARPSTSLRVVVSDGEDGGVVGGEADGAFIAASRTLIPDLLALATEYRTVLAALVAGKNCVGACHEQHVYGDSPEFCMVCRARMLMEPEKSPTKPRTSRPPEPTE